MGATELVSREAKLSLIQNGTWMGEYSLVLLPLHAPNTGLLEREHEVRWLRSSSFSEMFWFVNMEPGQARCPPADKGGRPAALVRRAGHLWRHSVQRVR